MVAPVQGTGSLCYSNINTIYMYITIIVLFHFRKQTPLLCSVMSVGLHDTKTLESIY